MQVKDLNPLYSQAASLAEQPVPGRLAADQQGGERRISKIGPSYIYNTVDNPIFPTTGRKLSLSFEAGGPRRQQQVLHRARPKASLYKRAHAADVDRPARRVRVHQSLRPYDDHYRRTVCRSSRSCSSAASTASAASTSAASARATWRPGLVIGGNKSLLFNVEYLIYIAGPVRLVLFADAGQVRDHGESFAWTEPIQRLVTVNGAGARPTR